MIAFASSFPGSIRAFTIGPGQEIVLQKSAFLASEYGVTTSVFFNKKVGSGLIGGEVFIMQKASGSGLLFSEFDGPEVEYYLQAGQQIIVDTGELPLIVQKLVRRHLLAHADADFHPRAKRRAAAGHHCSQQKRGEKSPYQFFTRSDCHGFSQQSLTRPSYPQGWQTG